MKLIRELIFDLFTLLLPKVNTNDKKYLIFIVHPRDTEDIYKKIPLLKKAPAWALTLFERYMWPVTVSKIQHTETKEVYGFMVSTPCTAKTMLKNRELAKRKIKQALKLGYKKGGKIAALGALTSSLTYGGKDVYDGKIKITTGHAYTVVNIKNIFLKVTEQSNKEPQKIKLGIVGAAGSIGSGSAKLIADVGVVDFLLIDLIHKHERINSLKEELLKINPNIQIKITNNLNALNDRHIIIAATNHPDALIKKEHLPKHSVVIIDDAQPSDLSEEIFKMPNVLALEGGATKTKQITANFPFGLCQKDDNFSCMAEGLLLLFNNLYEKAHMGELNNNHIDLISKLAKKHNFEASNFQNYKESCIKNEKVKDILENL